MRISVTFRFFLYEIHHIVPLSHGDGQLNGQFMKGGTNKLNNLTILPKDEHRGAGNDQPNHTAPFSKDNFSFTLDKYLSPSDLNK